MVKNNPHKDSLCWSMMNEGIIKIITKWKREEPNYRRRTTVWCCRCNKTALLLQLNEPWQSYDQIGFVSQSRDHRRGGCYRVFINDFPALKEKDTIVFLCEEFSFSLPWIPPAPVTIIGNFWHHLCNCQELEV